MYKKTVTPRDCVDIWWMQDFLKEHATLEHALLPLEAPGAKEDHKISAAAPTSVRPAYKFLGTYFEFEDEALIAYSKGNPNLLGYELALAVLEMIDVVHPASARLRGYNTRNH